MYSPTASVAVGTDIFVRGWLEGSDASCRLEKMRDNGGYSLFAPAAPGTRWDNGTERRWVTYLQQATSTKGLFCGRPQGQDLRADSAGAWGDAAQNILSCTALRKLIPRAVAMWSGFGGNFCLSRSNKNVTVS